MRGALGALVVLLVTPARAEEPAPGTGEQRAGFFVFAEPGRGRPVTVLMPQADAAAQLRHGLRLAVDWHEDVVSGATPRVYAAPDVITSATRFSDERNNVGARATLRRGRWRAQAGYRYGHERDYRSHVLELGGGVQLFQHNTELSLVYRRSIDSVCTQDNRGIPVPLRQPMSDSVGCFAGLRGRDVADLGVDALDAALVQSVHPRVLLALHGSYQHVDGFQANPYRAVRLFDGRYEALEHHPTVRHRGALGVVAKAAIPRTRAALGADVRLYRDSWGVNAISAELSWDQTFLDDRLALRLRARYHHQGGARFYQDAGTAGAYDVAGPRSVYFTGDRELAPLADVLVGGALSYRQPTRARHLAAVELAARLDLIGYLRLGREPPNAQRAGGVVDALLGGASLGLSLR